MKATILDALGVQEKNFSLAEHLVSVLEAKGWQQEIFPLAEMEIKPCTSCGQCAVKNPGRCTIKDDMEKIYSAWANSQLVVFCTPVSFGGYHSGLKIAIDRAMPLNLGYFTIRKGELHHLNRYQSTPSLMTIGLMESNEPDEAQAFEFLTERNAVNMNIHRWASVIVTPGDDISDVHRRFREALEEVS